MVSKARSRVEGLNPPPGVTITPALIPANRAEGVVTLTATPPAAVGAYHQLAMQGVLRSGKTNLSVSLPALTVRGAATGNPVIPLPWGGQRPAPPPLEQRRNRPEAASCQRLRAPL